MRLCNTFTPASIEAAQTGISNIFKELLPDDEAVPVFAIEYNQLVFDSLLLTTDNEALDIVLMYEFEDNGSNIKKRDGRRALFSLLQTYMPVSNNSGNIIKAKLEAFAFDFNKLTIIAQITTFNKLSFQLSTSRNLSISTSEQWSYVTSSISSTRWETFRTTLQPQWKSQSTLWLIDQIREHVLGSSDATTDSTKRYSGLGAISSPSDALDARFATLDSRFAAITASLAAITTATEVKSRSKGKPRGSTRERPAVPKYPCRWCQGAHYDRECPTLTNKTKKPQIPPQNGHAGAITDSDHPGFLRTRDYLLSLNLTQLLRLPQPTLALSVRDSHHWPWHQVAPFLLTQSPLTTTSPATSWGAFLPTTAPSPKRQELPLGLKCTTTSSSSSFWPSSRLSSTLLLVRPHAAASRPPV
jgi:hypothetical protein